MSDPIDISDHRTFQVTSETPKESTRPAPLPSNRVYLRVGEEVLRTAHEGVKRNLTPQEMMRDIIDKHNVHLSVGEIRLLLATRRSTANPL